MENGNNRRTEKSIILHMPVDLLVELDVLCANNYSNRTAFIVASFRLLIDCIEKQSLIPPWDATVPTLTTPSPPKFYAPDDEDAYWIAAEEDDEDY